MSTKKVWVCQTYTHTKAWLMEVPDHFTEADIEDIDLSKYGATAVYDRDPEFEVLDELPHFKKENHNAYEI
jgi:hypothetical protein